MAHVVVDIAGRTYRMACDDGEEDQLRALASLVESKIVSMRESFGDIGEQRSIVMAAISIADESRTLREAIERLTSENAELKSAAEAATASASELERRIADSLEAATQRLERLAAGMEDAPSEKEGPLFAEGEPSTP
jgi:cell division protein ZapA